MKTITRWPLAERQDVLAALRPDTPIAGDAPLRTLKRHAEMSSGVRLTARSGSRLSGTVHVYSALNVDAARFARVKNGAAARAYASAASRVEELTLALLRRLSPEAVRTRRPQAATDWEILTEIAKAMSSAATGLPEAPGVESIPGWVDVVFGDRMRVTSTTGRLLDLPAVMIREAGARLGDPVIVTRQQLAGTVLISIERALADTEDDDFGDELMGEGGMSPLMQSLLDGIRQPGLIDELHDLAANQEPWVDPVEHIAG